jgi:aspartate-semialdehyde dehydrogenase
MNKIPVTILGATGVVGQRFISMLTDHPFFEIVSLAASDRSAGKKYTEAATWMLPSAPPKAIQNMTVSPLTTQVPGTVAFSALPASIAKEIEPEFAKAGYILCSNASALRTAPGVPLLIPEINADHLKMIPRQKELLGWKGLAVTSPNCTTNGIAMTLKPLDDAFGIEKVFATTLQAVSGAGYPGHSSLDIMDNVLPFIKGEEEKIESETNMLLGKVKDGERKNAQITVSAQANRVPVIDGHTICLSIAFKHKPTPAQAAEALREFRGSAALSKMPTAPNHPIIVREEANRPQPRRDRDAGNGMSVSVGRIRECNILDLKMVTVVHNAVRGAAGGSVLNAELLHVEGFIR